VLNRIFGSRRDKVTGEWRKLHNEELRDLYSSSSMIRIIKSRRMRWAVGSRCQRPREDTENLENLSTCKLLIVKNNESLDLLCKNCK
jgi:hypothetical protein